MIVYIIILGLVIFGLIVVFGEIVELIIVFFIVFVVVENIFFKDM